MIFAVGQLVWALFAHYLGAEAETTIHPDIVLRLIKGDPAMLGRIPPTLTAGGT